MFLFHRRLPSVPGHVSPPTYLLTLESQQSRESPGMIDFVMVFCNTIRGVTSYHHWHIPLVRSKLQDLPLCHKDVIIRKWGSHGPSECLTSTVRFLGLKSLSYHTLLPWTLSISNPQASASSTVKWKVYSSLHHRLINFQKFLISSYSYAIFIIVAWFICLMR